MAFNFKTRTNPMERIATLCVITQPKKWLLQNLCACSSYYISDKIIYGKEGANLHLTLYLEQV